MAPETRKDEDEGESDGRMKERRKEGFKMKRSKVPYFISDLTYGLLQDLTFFTSCFE